MARRMYIWGWPYAILLLITWLIKHSLTVWHYFIAHFTNFQCFDSSFTFYWSVVMLWLWRAVWFCTILLMAWYVWDWLRGYAILDPFSYRLRHFLLRSTAGNTDSTLDISSQKQANHYIKSVKMRYCWSSPHLIVVSIRLPNDQTIAKIVRDRIVGGLGDDEISVISLLNRSQCWPLKGRYWELNQNSSRYLRIIGRKD